MVYIVGEENGSKTIDPKGTVESGNSSLKSDPQAMTLPDSVGRVVFAQLRAKRKFIFLAGGLMTLGLVVVILIGLFLSRGQNQGDGSNGGTSPAISTQGKIAFLRESKLWVHRLGQGAEPREVSEIELIKLFPESVISKMVWSSDGLLLAYNIDNQRHTENVLQAFNLASQETIEVLSTGAAGPIYDFTWVPGTNDLAISYAFKETPGTIKHLVGRRSVLGFPQTRPILEWVRPITEIEISVNNYIYFLDEKGDLWRQSLDGGKFFPVLQSRGIKTFDVSPDGTKIVFERVVDEEVWVSNENGENVKQITFTTEERKSSYGKGGRTNPSWSPDSSRILFVESAVNYVGIGLVNEDGSNLRSLESNPVSPKIMYDQHYQRELSDPQWVSSDQIIFLAQAPLNPALTSDVYVLSVKTGEYAKLIEGVQNLVWTAVGT